MLPCAPTSVFASVGVFVVAFQFPKNSIKLNGSWSLGTTPEPFNVAIPLFAPNKSENKKFTEAPLLNLRFVPFHQISPDKDAATSTPTLVSIFKLDREIVAGANVIYEVAIGALPTPVVVPSS